MPAWLSFDTEVRSFAAVPTLMDEGTYEIEIVAELPALAVQPPTVELSNNLNGNQVISL